MGILALTLYLASTGEELNEEGAVGGEDARLCSSHGSWAMACEM